MNRNSPTLRTVVPLVLFLFLTPLACTINRSLPVSQVTGSQADAGAGTSRANPVPVGTLLSIPGWEIRVLQFLRGEEALSIINTADWQADPLPAGQEYALAKIFVRCTSLDEGSHSLGISDLFITGSSNLAYGDTMDSWPQPEFLFEDMFTAEAVEGWIDAVIPVEEHDLMVVLDTESDVRYTRFLALNDGASISLPTELSKLQPNSLGVDYANPAAAGQSAITPAWEVTVLDSVGGQEAASALQIDNPYYSPPAAGTEFLLALVRLRYFDPGEHPAWVGSSTFFGVDSSGFRAEGDYIYPPSGSDRVWINQVVMPGATLEGWVVVTIPEGMDQPVIAFYPDSDNQRYLSVK